MKKQLEELVHASYFDGTLDDATVKKIADKLNRSMLKLYIGMLKQEEKKKMVFVTTPKPLSIKDREKLKSLFPKKKIVEEIDPSMIGGIKIVENDEAYDMDLNRTFHDIIRFVNNND
jgi:F0F1-type ATP synthase delta subunit